jgi:hypothetical protein
MSPCHASNTSTFFNKPLYFSLPKSINYLFAKPISISADELFHANLRPKGHVHFVFWPSSLAFTCNHDIREMRFFEEFLDSKFYFNVRNL